jgi:hypothetical protein
VGCAPTALVASAAVRFCVCPPGQPAASRDGANVIIPYFAIRNVNLPGEGPLLGSDFVIEAAFSGNNGLVWQTVTVARGSGSPGIFPVAAYDDAGNAYVAWAAQRAGNQAWEVHLARSLDGGATWEPDVLRVSAGGTNVLPWAAAGAEGQVALAWYHTEEQGHPESVEGLWHVQFAQVTGAQGATPQVQRSLASPEPVHEDDLSISGLGGAGDRDLLDFLSIAIDAQGMAHIAYADDHTDGHDGHAHVYYVKQVA